MSVWRLKVCPSRIKLIAQGVVVFDHAVVHHRELSAFVEMRMRIVIRHAPVRGPARVTDADAAFDRLVLDQRREICNAPHALADFDAAAIQRGDARGVIAAIFQPAQPIEEDGSRVCFADVANNAAHKARKVADFRALGKGGVAASGTAAPRP